MMSVAAWIIAGLRSQSVDNVRIVMDRLICVPVVPPIETIRNIGLILASAPRELHPIIGQLAINSSSSSSLVL
jgi:hypothetical protein